MQPMSNDTVGYRLGILLGVYIERKKLILPELFNTEHFRRLIRTITILRSMNGWPKIYRQKTHRNQYINDFTLENTVQECPNSFFRIIFSI